MNEETKEVFSPRPMVSYRSLRKISSYLVRAKLYPLDRVVGSTKCGNKRSEVCMNVSNTNTFVSSATGETYKIDHKLTCDDNCLISVLSLSVVENSILAKLVTALGTDGITIRIIIESILTRGAVS